MSEQRDAVIQARIEVGDAEAIGSLRCVATALGDQRRQIAVTGAVLRQQDELWPVGEPYLRADEKIEPGPLRRDMRAHRSGKRAFVGDRERGIAQFVRALDQLFGMRGAAQEAEVGKAMQLGVVGEEL